MTDFDIFSPSNKQLKLIVPGSTQFCFISKTPVDYQLEPSELELTTRMSAKRLNDFKASRYCAKNALKQTGITNFPLLINQHRAPIWPRGIVGSLSHCENLCIAVIASQKEITGFGIDIESLAPLKSELLPLICSSKEIDLLNNTNNSLINAKILFSIKESIFKCLHPSVEVWIDFKDVELELNGESLQYTAKLTESLVDKVGRSEIFGHWHVENGFIFSSCWLNP